MNWFDKLFDRGTRSVAHNSSRRSAITGVAKLLVGSAFVLPVLPFDRSAKAAEREAAKKAAHNDDTSCDYWRYCAIDGFLCTCCGGGINTCPPGTEPSAVAWIGTCRNPNDGKDYLISYNDCCGVTACGKCACNNNVGDRPGYRLGSHNDVNWCMAHGNSMYHCTVVAAVGIADGA
ncbi:methylamine dehydrogenase light chain [Derxia gummosa]|uniref:Methylamine dehydrogenase light chain n=1 Tax=Derxia gummosa DSM 723 TaxID=1121388 RepID=A0A8B6X4Q8_9BURK|nr:methylamine dehydrogenase light chain [Derxia gummosa]